MLKFSFDEKMTKILLKKSGIHNLPTDLWRKADKIIKRIAKSNRQHFKMDGWDLNVDSLVIDVMDELFDVHDMLFGIKLELAKRSNANLVYGSNPHGAVLSITDEDKQRSVYYNSKTNKLTLKKTIICPGKPHLHFLGNL